MTLTPDAATSPRVRQLRLIIHTDDFERALAFYHDALGLPARPAFQGQGDARVAILDAGTATVEISNTAQVALIDDAEAGGSPSDRLRIAFEVDDAPALTRALVGAGAELEAEPRETPWRSLNSRLRDNDGLQLTHFQELVTLDERKDAPGFTTPGEA